MGAEREAESKWQAGGVQTSSRGFQMANLFFEVAKAGTHPWQGLQTHLS